MDGYLHVFWIGVINFVESMKKHTDTTKSLFAHVHTASCLCWKYFQITTVCRFVAYIAHTIRTTTLTKTLSCAQSVCLHPKMQIISTLFLYVKKNHRSIIFRWCAFTTTNYTASKITSVLHTLNWSISSGKFSTHTRTYYIDRCNCVTLLSYHHQYSDVNWRRARKTSKGTWSLKWIDLIAEQISFIFGNLFSS